MSRYVCGWYGGGCRGGGGLKSGVRERPLRSARETHMCVCVCVFVCTCMRVSLKLEVCGCAQIYFEYGYLLFYTHSLTHSLTHTFTQERVHLHVQEVLVVVVAVVVVAMLYLLAFPCLKYPRTCLSMLRLALRRPRSH